MRRWLGRVVCLGTLVAIGLVCARQTQAQAIVVSGKSIDALLDGTEAILSEAVPPELGEQVLPVLQQFRQNDAFAGLDRTKPFGIWVAIPPEQAQPPTVAAAIPITDLTKAIESVKAIGMNVEEAGVPGFSHKLTLPDGNTTLYIAATKEYAFLSMTPEKPEALTATKPADWMPRHGKAGDLTMTLRFDQLPEWVKKTMLDQIEQGMALERERQPDELEARYHGRQAAMNLSSSAFKALLAEGADLSIDWAVDRERGEAALEVSLSGREGTDLQKTLKSFGDRRSLFEPVGETAPFSASMAIPVPKEFRDVLTTSFDIGAKEALERAPNEKSRELANRFMECMRPIFGADVFDGRFDLVGPVKSTTGASHYTIFAALRVPNGKQVDETLRAILNEALKDNEAVVALDFAKAADGTPIHKISTNKEQDAQLAKLIGDDDLFVAIRDDAIVAAFGEAGQATLEQALAAIGKPAPSGTNPPVNVAAHAGQLLQAASLAHPEVSKLMEALKLDPSSNKQSVHLTLGAPEGVLRLRLTAGFQAIRVMMSLGTQAAAAPAEFP